LARGPTPRIVAVVCQEIIEAEMIDIVERLRKNQCPTNSGCNPLVEYCQCNIMDDSADEIEKLRWENANMEKLWRKSEGTWMEIRDKQDAEIERLRKVVTLLIEYEEHDENIYKGAVMWEALIEAAHRVLMEKE
jgi:CRISPR/Cas system CMR-associated protein Cmr1 (group 7 of RAMP superfamily)